jgi:hypothetical protein
MKKQKKSSAEKPSLEAAAAKAKISKEPFIVWFHKKVRQGLLKLWQEDEIKTFFREKGLKDIEDTDKYEETLKVY